MFRLMLLAVCMAVNVLSVQVRAADNNVKFKGTLVAEPCVVPPGNENIPLDFGTIIDKYLYANGRTKSEPFAITLTECDPAIAGTVRVTFTGTPNTALPDLLALDAGSTASGIAIGLETEDGTAQPLNKPSVALPLKQGAMVLNWLAYVQGEPDAIATRNITRGPFTATATFSLDYE